MTGVVKPLRSSSWDGEDAAIHHVARRHGVGTGARVRERHLRKRFDGRVVLDDSVFRDVATVAVIRGPAEAHVAPHEQLGRGGLDGGDGLGMRPFGSVAALACASL